jgi:polyisoprenoid-binding protein YceI
MNSTRKLCCVALVLAVIVAISPRLLAAPTFKIDPVMSAVVFKIKHLGISNAYGRFNEISGTYSVDAKDPSKSSIEVTIPAASVDTNNKKRDEHLRGSDFFKTKQFPNIVFKSKSIKSVGKGKFKLTGEVTLLGKTKTVESVLVHTGDGKGFKGETRSGYEATLIIKRSDFGMTYGLKNMGDEVALTISIQGFAE